MKMNRKRVMVGAAGLGLVGALATGGAALAATGSPGPAGPSASATAPGYGPMAGFGGTHGPMAGFGGVHGGMFGATPMLTTAAQYLGMSETDLRAQLQTGKSLADVAQAQGKSVSGLEDAIVAAVKANIEANTALSADQKTALLAQVQSRVTAMVTTAHPVCSGDGTTAGFGGMHWMGGR